MPFLGLPLRLAYIDPGSGALIWQSTLAAGAGAVFYFRRFFFRLRRLVRPDARSPERKEP